MTSAERGARLRRWFRTVGFLVRKEFLQVFRDRVMLFEMIAIPIIQLLILSNAATFEVHDSRVHVVDESRTAESRGLVRRIGASRYFTVVSSDPSMAKAERDLATGRASVIVRIPRRFADRIESGRTAPVQLVLDAVDGATAGVVRSYLGAIVERHGAELEAEAGPAPGTRGAVAGPAAPLAVRSRGLFNPTLDYKDFIVPGILVLLVTLIGTLITSMNIAREKEIGTLEQLNVTPLRKSEFVAGKLVPFWIIALAELSVGLVIARLAFALPVRGNLLLLFGAAGLYMVVALGVGLWISTVVETQQQAMFLTFFVMMLYVFMSGFMTPIESMPGWARALTELNPVRHFLLIMRGILLKGAGFADLWRPLAVLAVMGVTVLSLALRQYSKTTG
ncbi:MAG: ABC transporter permease [Candidatus Palauibacterales bacterium]|nr:ABC transporter permease [Candidatus Palauibacterales bacterium]